MARRRATAASRAAARRLFSSPVSYHSRESWTSAPLEIRDVRVATTEDVQRALELRRHQTLRAFQRVSHHALLAEELFLGGKEPTARLGPHLAKRRVRTRVGPENLGTDDVEDVIPGNARRTGGTREVPSLGGRALVRRERGGDVGPTAHPSRRVPGHCDARGTERTIFKRDATRADRSDRPFRDFCETVARPFHTTSTLKQECMVS